MAKLEATIGFICTNAHAGEKIARGQQRYTITLVEGVWAYCKRGGAEDHRWERIAPTSVN
jgi:hypothetical protein